MNYPSTWQQKKLIDCLEKLIDYRGKSPPKSSSGIPLITARNVRMGKLDFSVKEYILESDYDAWMSRGIPKPEDLLLTTEAPLGMVAMFPSNGKYAVAQRTVTLRPSREKLDSRFLMNFLLSTEGQRRLEIKSSGSTAKGIKQSELRQILIPLPPLPEQQKISEILSTWDEAIDLTQQLIDAKKKRKKGLMQKLLWVAKGDESPKLRLSEYRDSWHLTRFGDIFERVTRKNSEGNNNPLTISAQHGLVSQTQFFNKVVASDSLDRYYLLRCGEFAYNKSYSEGYPFGAFKRLDKYDAGALSTLYICFRIIDSDTSSDYFVHFFESGGMNRGIYSIAQEGARNHGLLNMSVKDVFNLHIYIPSYEEQKELAKFFNMLDEEILLLKKKLAALQKQKKGLMQQLLTGKTRVKV